ncbi:MAG: MarR family winged helix-turn-helix transcriptional regulator [Solirubrobacterales bacterium]
MVEKHPDDLVDLFWRNVEIYRVMEDSALKHNKLHQLSAADIRAIYRIGVNRRERMSNLARQMRLTVGTLTLTIDRLVDKGIVVRERNSKDRRVVEVRLTPRGHEVFNDIIKVRRSIAQKVLGRLDDQERDALRDILKKLRS